MNVNLLIITHIDIGTALIRTAQRILGDELPLPLTNIPVNYDTDPDLVLARIERAASHLSAQDGLLILTDMFGATPSNIANALRHPVQTRVVSGLNLPMLIRVLNYPQLSLHALAEKALSGGQEGVMYCHPQHFLQQDATC